jgi:hypothetical protein
MSKAKIRNQCPICGDSSSKFVCRMGKEYLETSAEGWQLDPLRNRMTGLDFEADTEAGINYVECDGCGTFYVDSVYPVEDTFASLQEEIPISDRYSNTNSANLIRGLIKRMHTDSALIRMALDSTSASDPKVLDYGCGIGWDLSIFRAKASRLFRLLAGLVTTMSEDSKRLSGLQQNTVGERSRSLPVTS